MASSLDLTIQMALIKEMLGEPLSESQFGDQLIYGAPCCNMHACDTVIAYIPDRSLWKMEYGCHPVYTWKGSFQELLTKLADESFREGRLWLPSNQ